MFRSLISQVGGHPGVLTSEDGSLVIKAAVPIEITFYESVSSDPNFVRLRPFVPRFYGTLRLTGRIAETSGTQDSTSTTVLEALEEVVKDEYLPSIVLENLQHSFLKSNVLDIKLGTELYDEDATPEKRARMEKTARETTSLETGVRLTGFQVYDLTIDTPVVTPKSYGKSLKPADLPTGIARFFPLSPLSSPPSPISSSSTSHSSSRSGSISSSSASKLSSTSSSGTTSVSTLDINPEPGPSTSTDSYAVDGVGTRVGTGLPSDILLPILRAMRGNIAEIRAAIARMEMRMVGGSLLIVYEADWDRARAGLRVLEEMEHRSAQDETTIEEVGVGQEDLGEGVDEEEEEHDDEDKDEDEDDSRPKPIGPPYVIKLIDFAHTRILPGRGPDEGVLLGLDTVLRLLDGRIEEIKAAS